MPQPYANHNGGQLQFGPDGKLYVGMGDGGSGGDPNNNGQNPRALLAKLLRTNPLSADWEIAGYGLRNPWRFSFDRKTGDLYIGDVGQNSREEIDYRPRGAPPANFGWARYEGSRTFDGDIDLDPSTPLVFPIHEYGHGEGCSVTGGYVYRGKDVPAAVGRYFFGDYCSGTVWSLRVAGGDATGVRREPFDVSSISSFGEGARGELYLVSHEGDDLPAGALEGVQRAHDPCFRAERREEALERSRAGLEGVQTAPDSEVRSRHACQRLRRVREGADPRARGSHPPQLRVRVGIRSQVDASMVLCEALEERSPVADRRVQRCLVGIVVELNSIAPPRVLEPCSPERLGVAEHRVQVDGDRAGHATARRAARPST